jgi:glycosyltransferase involved in cell wall biosynthesis
LSRVLLVCPEPLSHRHPAGVGIRFLEFARLLRSEGHHVTLLSPDAAEIEGAAAGALDYPTIARESEQAEVAIVQGHVANDFFAAARRIPTVIDLYDPFVIENLHYWRERGDEVFDHDHATLLRSLRRGDFFLCASRSQRLFYLGLLLGELRVTPELFDRNPKLDTLLALVPFGVPPLPARQPGGALPQRILFGGIYDWYDPTKAIDSVAIARERLGGLELVFNRHPNAEITPQSRAAEAERYATRHAHRFVRFEPWAPYDQRLGYYERFGCALLTFPPSLETDLAMRTRLFDYFWAALPVVTSPAEGTDEIVERYGAGTVVRSNQPEDFAAEIVELFESRERAAAMIAGARRWAGEHQWAEVCAPLLEFCRSPRLTAPQESGPVEALPAARPLAERLRRRLRRFVGGFR